jgi:hypothetical protein
LLSTRKSPIPVLEAVLTVKAVVVAAVVVLVVCTADEVVVAVVVLVVFEQPAETSSIDAINIVITR